MNNLPYILFTKIRLKGGFRNIFLILLSLTSLQSFSASQISWTGQSFNLGRLHTCAQGVNDVFCWGYDSDPSGNATDVPTLGNVQKLVLGSYFGCAIDGTSLNCWGKNDYGQSVPPNLNNVIDLAAGSSHACALSQVSASQNQLICWGDNSDGRATVPSGLNNPTQLSAAYHHSCVIDGATVKCWGRDSFNETTDKTLNNPTKVVVGAYANCAFDDDGVTCWGRESDTVQFTDNVLKVGLGFSHGCALIDEGANNRIQCWGDNSDYQTDVPSLSNPTDLAVGRSNACAIDSGEVICWGYKSRWETSEADITWQNSQQLTAGEDHFCALNQGALNCFGDDKYGQVIIPNTDNDSVNDVYDAFPTNPNETHDRDLDGVGDNSDVFPNDPAETQDSDNDGVGDNADAFPNDASETTDTDGDGVGDNTDDFPTDPARSRDTDGDGYDDLEDAFDNDPTEWLDTDGDGVGNNTDAYINDPTAWVATVMIPGSDLSIQYRTDGFWGDWGPLVTCPTGQYVMGYMLRSEMPTGDDTALNDIILYCNSYEKDPADSPTPIQSAGGPWGKWTYPGYCPTTSPVNGFAMQMEFPHSGDDTAANDIRLICSNFRLAFSPVYTHWGYWLSEVTCPENTVVTGLMTRVEAKTGDDTALNGLRLQCSQAPNL